mgnify:CR=1 FL=1
MQLFAFGINHVSAPLAVREQVVFHAEGLIEALIDRVAEIMEAHGAIDIDERKVEAINQCRSYIQDVPAEAIRAAPKAAG